MNYLIMLAGGAGTRMKASSIPKQYIEVCGKPVIMYSLDTFQKHESVDGIVIVAQKQWREKIKEWIAEEKINKFLGFADPGTSRQGSIYNGLRYLLAYAQTEDYVIIHDAARPLVSEKLISACFDGLRNGDAVMPVLPAKDTYYRSADGGTIESLIPRSQLYAGQAPEAFHYRKYLSLHDALNSEEIDRITGSTELAYRGGLKTVLIPGEDRNFKITTQSDLDMFRTCVEGGKL